MVKIRDERATLNFYLKLVTLEKIYFANRESQSVTQSNFEPSLTPCVTDRS